MRQFSLQNLCDCSLEQQLCVLDIRNGEAVRNAMYSDHIISRDEHLNYIDALRSDKKQRIFAVLNAEATPVGVVGLNNIDLVHKKSDWAFYLDASARGGVGSALEIFMLNHVFEDLGLEKLNCEVLETNPMVVAMHKKFGFSEEGYRRANVIKDGVRIGVHFLGITREEWQAHKPHIMQQLSGKIADIHIEASAS